MKKMAKITLGHFTKSLSIVVGLVLVWRGVWYVLDAFDVMFFGSSHMWTSIGGIVVGLLVLYLPDHDLKELEKL